jgi:hypothetical protein
MWALFAASFEEKTHRIESEKQSCLRPHRKMSKDDFH